MNVLKHTVISSTNNSYIVMVAYMIFYFYIKSFDLDLKMGYKLATVMGYGYK